MGAAEVLDLVGVGEGGGDGVGVVDVDLGHPVEDGFLGDFEDGAPGDAGKEVQAEVHAFHPGVGEGEGGVILDDGVIAGDVGAAADADVAAAVGDEVLDQDLSLWADFVSKGLGLTAGEEDHIVLVKAPGSDVVAANRGHGTAHPFHGVGDDGMARWCGACPTVVGYTEIQRGRMGRQVHKVRVHNRNPNHADDND